MKRKVENYLRDRYGPTRSVPDSSDGRYVFASGDIPEILETIRDKCKRSDGVSGPKRAGKTGKAHSSTGANRGRAARVYQQSHHHHHHQGEGDLMDMMYMQGDTDNEAMDFLDYSPSFSGENLPPPLPSFSQPSPPLTTFFS